MEASERLRDARRKAGFKSAAAAARRLGIPYGTYSGHEAGSRGIRSADYNMYARAFNVTASWLAFGHEGQVSTNEVTQITEITPIVGTFGTTPDNIVQFHVDQMFDGVPQGYIIKKNGDLSDPDVKRIYNPSHFAPKLEIDGKPLSALYVSGDMADKIAVKHSLVYFHRRDQFEEYSDSGDLCLSQLEHGDVVIGFVKRAGEGVVDIEGIKQGTLRKQRITSAYLVMAIVPGRTAWRLRVGVLQMLKDIADQFTSSK